jgi:hypothetical protein
MSAKKKTKKQANIRIMPVDMAEISLVDAIAFVESNRYLCVPLDSPDDDGALSAFSLDNVRASLAWLCVALFAFFAFRLYRTWAPAPHPKHA